MNAIQLNAYIRRLMPHQLCVTVTVATSLYRQMQGEPIRYQPYIQEVRDGYAIAAYNYDETFDTQFQALCAGMRLAQREADAAGGAVPGGES